MATARAFLFSYLGFQHRFARADFSRRFPHPWLVWEPGNWHPPASNSRTLVPTHPTTPAAGDALCLELALPEGGQLTCGRNPEHPLVVNDGTFSRNQFVFTRGPDGLRVAAIPGAQPALLNGVPLGIQPVLLVPGARLRAGDVSLRFCEGAELEARIVAELHPTAPMAQPAL